MGVRAYSGTVLGDRPVLYMPGWFINAGNSSVRDYTGINGLSAATVGTIIHTPGPIGALGVKFSGGAGNRIDFADIPVLDLGDVWSLEAWYKPSNLTGAQSIICKGSNAYYMRQAVAQLSSLRSNVAVLTNSNQDFVVNVWYHCVATKNGSARKLYMNGKDVTTLVGDSVCTDTAIGLSIGCQFTGTFTEQTSGSIAHAAVYRYPLSPAQVLNHYRQGRYSKKKRRR